MSTIDHSPSDHSVQFSLIELARIEAERVREEDLARERSRQQAAKQKREADEARRAAAQAEVAAEAEALARRLREEAEEQARLEARERAEVEVARIAAEARARLDEDNAGRAHEIAVLQIRNDGVRRRLRTALGAVIVLAIAGGSTAAYSVDRHIAGLVRDPDQLREGQQALAREREHAKATELAALDRRLDALRARPSIADAGEALRTAREARNAVDPKALDQDRLRAFADALDALEARLVTADRVAALDRRRDDLAVWATSLRRGEALTEAKAAGTRARVLGTDEAAVAYASALDRARDGFAKSPAMGWHGKGAAASDKGGTSCLPGDPGCGFDGRPIF
jgi:hypothetical protein